MESRIGRVCQGDRRVVSWLRERPLARKSNQVTAEAQILVRGHRWPSVEHRHVLSGHYAAAVIRGIICVRGFRPPFLCRVRAVC